jgi:nicotinamide phosphoribosyltransferase
MYYNADSDKEMVGGSVPATEHSVMCVGGKLTEKQTVIRLLTEVYPEGVVSIVSDTWDYWNMIANIYPDPEVKKIIMNRKGKVVARPDSGNPIKIINGDPAAPTGSVQHMGTLRSFQKDFGGAMNSKNYFQLDPHIGAIYGDSMNLWRTREMLTGMRANRMASTNIVIGNGSFSYQLVTRDTLGFAVKATAAIVDGEHIEIFKDPVTDNGVKKSAKGLLRVDAENGDLVLREGVTEEEEKGGVLTSMYLDGELKSDYTLKEIRERLESYL